MQWTSKFQVFGKSRRHKALDDLSDEMRLHIEERVEQLQREGLTVKEAERQARIAFGNVALVQERSRDVWHWPTLESIWSDARLAMRQLRRSPGFTGAAILTLALAIGANAVVFSILNAFLLRPLNVAHPERLYQLQHGDEASAYQSYPDYLDLRDRNRSFDNLMAYTVDEVGLESGGDPTEVWVEEATGNYFDGLGLKPYLGHFFHAEDEHGAGSAPDIVLSYEYWHTHFQDDRSIVGRVVRLNRHPFTILGVAPKDFNGTLLFFNPAMWVPLIEHPALGAADNHDLETRGSRWIFETMGELKPAVTTAQATADLNAIGAQLEKAYPKDESKMTFKLASPTLYGDYLGGPVKAFMSGLMLLTSLILLAACANLGSLFAARAADRSREVALRLALGATRRRILRGLFTEAILISIVGGCVGVLGSVALLRMMSAWRPFPNWPIHLAVNPDSKVYLIALLLALVSGLLFGAVPVRQVLRTNPYETVKASSSGRGGRGVNLREVLLVAQIAICAVLVTSSLVAVRGLIYSLHAHLGFDTENTMLAETDLSMAGYGEDRASAMQKEMIHAMESIPGVEAVGLADTVPFETGASDTTVFADNTTDLRPKNATAHPVIFHVAPGYFRAAGTALLSGRDFTWQDDKSAPQVAVVNSEFARRLFGSVSGALGRFYKTKDGKRMQVVGVTEDGKYDHLSEDPSAAVFVSILQSPVVATTLVVRARSHQGSANNTAFDVDSLADAMRSKLRQLDAGMPVIIQTRTASIQVSMFAPRMATVALGVLGIMGAMLSITGIFGMAAYSVSRRLKELGIRVALGAQHWEVLQAALGRAVKLLAIGSVAGLVLGLFATRVLAFIVFQATPRDPLVLAGVVLAMGLVGLVATWIPAQRALSVNPLVLLREE
ncbi:ABC transporter permease [Acidicapsa acidisoli]|uniref:ABC transporter permease n=1 Tax=Acidicapsa acidisoli TaxID=1615681 RepID=UPI0021DFFF93|nr:ABC transporter permease [Acidicapsa acidisoli]